MNFFALFYCYLFLIPVFTFQLPPQKLNWKDLKLKFIRKNIDVIDDQIYFLTYQRIQYAKHLQKLKPSIRDPVREVAIISRLQKKKNWKKRLSVIYGPCYSNSHILSKKKNWKKSKNQKKSKSKNQKILNKKERKTSKINFYIFFSNI